MRAMGAERAPALAASSLLHLPQLLPEDDEQDQKHRNDGKVSLVREQPARLVPGAAITHGHGSTANAQSAGSASFISRNSGLVLVSLMLTLAARDP